jgi:hypothetical protein
LPAYALDRRSSRQYSHAFTFLPSLSEDPEMRKLQLIAVLAALCFAACGGGDDDADDDTTTADAAPSADGGPQVDAMAAGAPTLTGVSAHLSAGGTQPAFFEFTGTDAEGDASAVRFSFLDATGALIVLTEDDATFVDQSPDVPFGTDTSFTRKMRLTADSLFDPTAEGAAVTVRLAIVDAAGNVSNSIDAPIEINPTLGNAGDVCGSGVNYCDTDFTCVDATCAAPANQASECAAADASTAITASTETMVTLLASTGEFEGSCGFTMGHNEEVLKITLDADSHLVASTDATPSADTLDSYIYLRSACAVPSSEIACNDDIDFSAGNARSTLDIPSLPAGTYYLYIDGSLASADGSATVTGDVGVSITITANKAAGAACNPTTDSCVAGYSCFDAANGTNGICRTPEEIVTAQCAAAGTLVAGIAVNGLLRKTGPGLYDGSCTFSPGQAEAFHKLDVATRSEVTVSTDDPGTLFDTVVYILDGVCSTTGVEHADSCDDDSGETSLTSTVTLKLDPGSYTVVVDRAVPADAEEADPTPYKLTYTSTPVVGLNGVCLAGVSVCDDGLVCTAGFCVAM